MPDTTPSLDVDPAILVERVRAVLRRPRATVQSWAAASLANPN